MLLTNLLKEGQAVSKEGFLKFADDWIKAKKNNYDATNHMYDNIARVKRRNKRGGQ